MNARQAKKFMRNSGTFCQNVVQHGPRCFSYTDSCGLTAWCVASKTGKSLYRATISAGGKIYCPQGKGF